MKMLFQRVTDSLRALGITAAAYVVMALLVLLGASFLCAAGVMALAAEIGGIAAAAITGVAFLVLAGIVYGILAMLARRRKEKRRKAAANTAMVASGLSLANTGLRLASRAGGRKLIVPGVALALVAWFLTREHDD